MDWNTNLAQRYLWKLDLLANVYYEDNKIDPDLYNLVCFGMFDAACMLIAQSEDGRYCSEVREMALRNPKVKEMNPEERLYSEIHPALLDGIMRHYLPYFSKNK